MPYLPILDLGRSRVQHEAEQEETANQQGQRTGNVML